MKNKLLLLAQIVLLISWLATDCSMEYYELVVAVQLGLTFVAIMPFKIRGKFLLMALIPFVSSCVTEKGAMKYYLKHNDKLAELAAAKFPVKERVVPGVPVITHDTITQTGPTIPCPQAGGKSAASVKCPDTKSVNTKESVRDTIYQEDTAKLTAIKNKYDSDLAALQAKYQALLTSNSQLQGNFDSAKLDLKKANDGLTWYKWACTIAALIIVLMGIKIIKS